MVRSPSSRLTALALLATVSLTLPAGPARAQGSAPASQPADDVVEAEPPVEAPASAPATGPASAPARDVEPAPDTAASTETPEAVPEETAPDAEVVDEPELVPAVSDEPNVEERRLVAYVATGVAAASLAVGATVGFLAQQDYACLADVVACNATREDPITGTEFLDAVAEVEHKAVLADMMYVLAATSAVVAVTGYLRGFVFTGEQEDAAAAPEALLLPTPFELAAAPEVR